MSCVLVGLRRKRLDDIQACKVSIVWLIVSTAEMAWPSRGVDVRLQIVSIRLTEDRPSREQGSQVGSENYVKEGIENGAFGQSKWRRNPPVPSGTMDHHERTVLQE